MREYVTLEIRWALIWRDIKQPFYLFLRWIGVLCRHPKGQRLDYGHQCGVCNHYLTMEEIRRERRREIRARERAT